MKKYISLKTLVVTLSLAAIALLSCKQETRTDASIQTTNTIFRVITIDGDKINATYMNYVYGYIDPKNDGC